MNTPSVKKRLLGWAHNLFGAGILVAFGYYLWDQRAQFAGAMELKASDAVLLAATVLVSWLTVAAQSWVMYRAMGLRVGFFESFMLGVAMSFGNYLPMRLGTLVRAHYLKDIYGLRYAHYGSVTAVKMMLTAVAAGLCGLVGAAGLSLQRGSVNAGLLGVFAGIMLAPCVAFVWRPRCPAFAPERAQRIWNDFLDGLEQLRQQPHASAVVLAMALLNNLTLGARFLVGARVMGVEASPMLLLMLAPMAALISFVALTPGALGLREAAMGYTTYLTGAPFFHGMYVGTLDRAVMLFMLALVGGASFTWVWMRIRAHRRLA